MNRHTLLTSLPCSLLTFFLLVALLLLCASDSRAQTAEAQTGAPPGVSVLKFSWADISRRPGWDEPLDPASGHDLGSMSRINTPEDDSRVPRPVGATSVENRTRSERLSEAQRRKNTDGSTQTAMIVEEPSPAQSRAQEYVYRVRVKNDGDGEIQAVKWDYLFFDPVTGQELSRHRFQNFQHARPGKTFTLTGTSAAPPTRVVSASAPRRDRSPKLEERILIRCVAYADGTVRWHHAASERDCESLLKRTRK